MWADEPSTVTLTATGGADVDDYRYPSVDFLGDAF